MWSLKKKKQKIFCISMQRNGTTSVGDFFELHGYIRAGWGITAKNDWFKKYFDGDYESIFNSEDFKLSEIFEDSPFGTCDFYKILFYRFPNSKFILITRKPEDWFVSMQSHSKGMVLGNTFSHCCIYNRESEYYEFIGENHSYENSEIDNLLPISNDLKNHYIEIYNNRNRQVLDFFRAKDPLSTRFIHLELEDEKKWTKLNEKFNLNPNVGLNIHSNKSNQNE